LEDKEMLKKILLVGMVMAFICSTSVGAEQSNKMTSPNGFEMTKIRLILDEKEDDYLMFNMRRLDVTSYTLIKDESGMLITFDDLEVPCEAMVSLYKKPGERRRFIAVSIEVKGKPQPKPE
jgi:hypothetical protein